MYFTLYVAIFVTRDEIARFWRRKKIEEEDHLLAAIKAAARIRARRLMVRIIISDICCSQNFSYRNDILVGSVLLAWNNKS